MANPKKKTTKATTTSKKRLAKKAASKASNTSEINKVEQPTAAVAAAPQVDVVPEPTSKPSGKSATTKLLSARLAVLGAKLTKQSVRTVLTSVLFARIYAITSVLILAGTTLLWSILGARLQNSNADQIVDPYLFQNGATFHGASFPGAHSFLLKWPLFWLVKLLGITSTNLVTVTVVTVMLTVLALVILLYRLERRALVFGTLCLALASCLLLVPAQPAVGVLLPVNMAMLATRNLEYVVYLLGLVLLVQARRTRNWRFWLAVVLLGVLVASDKLFLFMSVGGAGVALLVYGLRRNWRLVESSSRWLLAGIGAAILGYGILAVIQQTGLTHITNEANATPYQAVHGAKHVATALIYAVLGFLANFGANPAFDANVIGRIPHVALDRLMSLSGPAYILNGIVALGGLVAVWLIIKPTLFARRAQFESRNRAQVLSLLLIWTSLTAGAFFVVSDHYYPVDARYLTICLFTLFIAGATFSRQRQLAQSKYLVLAGALLIVGMLLAVPNTVHTYHTGQSALSATNNQNKLISQALSHHRVDVLVGDYWRVLPTKLATQGKLKVMPLANCTQARDTLTSKVWQPDLNKQSFAYLLSYDKGLTDYAPCSLTQVVGAYGRPNASILIAGTFSHPHEMLLFYDRGIHKSVPASTPIVPQPVASVVPINIDELPNPNCAGPTIMNIVAHQDDDLLFMNPDLLHDIHDGHCVRTVYITAGDAGADQFYWLSRQQGSEDAYATMIGMGDAWLQRIVKLSDNSYVTIATLHGDPKVSLVFMNLPDGGLYGDGFSATHNESLAKLEAHRISSVQTVDRQSSYTTVQLAAALETLMHTYQPAEIRTQSPVNINSQFPDHSDHLAVGRIVQTAHDKYEVDQFESKVSIPLYFYAGYPIHALSPNISGEDLTQKVAAFLAYAKHDNGVCHSASDCSNNPVYGSYLTRQYQH
jgi:LmbE family N-acetylglucosaminyl deacetylase